MTTRWSFIASDTRWRAPATSWDSLRRRSVRLRDTKARRCCESTTSMWVTSMGKVTLDVSLVGEIGSSELAAFAFVFPILFLLISVAGGIYVAAAAACAGAVRLDNGRVRRGPLLQSVLVSLILGALVAAVLHACLPGLL